MYSIGEFSRIVQLTIKTIRLYHEKGMLIPGYIDPDTGYRYYNKGNIERARVIIQLRKMEFPLETIKDILENYKDDSDMLSFLEKQKKNIEEKISRYNTIMTSIDSIIISEKESIMALSITNFDIEEKELKDILIASVRYKGKYSDCGKAMGQIARHLGKYICGKPLNLYYDQDYKENDADIETCFPVRKGMEVDGITIRHLPGGKCVSLIHKGPYDDLGRSYDRLMVYIKEKKYNQTGPTREHYLKGPGMIFRGNPGNYLTELQIMIET